MRAQRETAIATGEHKPEGAVTAGEETEAVPKTARQEVGRRVNSPALAVSHGPSPASAHRWLNLTGI